MQLEGDRIFLRDFRPDDVAEYQAYHADPLYLRYYAPEVADPAHARMLVDKFVDAAAARPRRDFTLAIVERATSLLIGCCSLRTSGQAPGSAELGLELAPKSWGRGLATEAATLMIDFGFGDLGLAELRGQSVTQNDRVARLVAKLGFRRLPQAQGPEWMTARGWTTTVWTLSRSGWPLDENVGLRISEADLSDPLDSRAVLDVLNSYATDPVGGGRPLGQDVRDRLPSMLREHPTALVLLARLDERPVGLAVCFFGLSTFRARPLLNIHDLAVLPGHRGTGVGRALLQAAEDRARREGCCKLTLEVQDDNARARALYQRFGFGDYVVAGPAPTRFLEKKLEASGVLHEREADT
jgi:RimJ/RimL family protein N-acetyltransferase